MSATITQAAGNLWEITISGELRLAELQAVQAGAAIGIATTGSIKALVVLDGFSGWSSADDWSDVSFAANQGDAMEKIAVAGDARWEAEVMMFLGAGLRKTAVRFFPEVGAARAWLLGSPL
jgi:hypothetical protein